jgi:hypothetical protein
MKRHFYSNCKIENIESADTQRLKFNSANFQQKFVATSRLPAAQNNLCKLKRKTV